MEYIGSDEYVEVTRKHPIREILNEHDENVPQNIDVRF